VAKIKNQFDLKEESRLGECQDGTGWNRVYYYSLLLFFLISFLFYLGGREAGATVFMSCSL
jgi:hypothetical protein